MSVTLYNFQRHSSFYVSAIECDKWIAPLQMFFHSTSRSFQYICQHIPMFPHFPQYPEIFVIYCFGL